MADSNIEWTDKVWNPITGCTQISAGCKNCYAERMANRLKGRFRYPADDPFKVTWHKDRINEPLFWRKPRRVFVCSMGDLFHEDVSDAIIADTFDLMEKTERHTYLILTKRPERMARWNKIVDSFKSSPMTPKTKPLFNVHLGVSIEDQATANERIPLLLQTPAAKRFVSYEPALGPVDFFPYLNVLTCEVCNRWTCNKGLPHRIIQKKLLDQIIMGGETGPGARPMHPDWARSVRDQCKEAGVPFFFKQWGKWLPESQMPTELYNKTFRAGGESKTPDSTYHRIDKKKAGYLLDGKEHRELIT